MRSEAQQNEGGSIGRREGGRPGSQLHSSLAEMRRNIGMMFSGESRVGRQRNSVIGPALESPKTPRLVLGLQNFSSTRLAIPYLNRTSISLPSSPVVPNPPPAPSRSPSSAQSPQHSLQTTTIHVVPSRGQRISPRTENIGVEPADVHLAELADIGRRRRRKGKSKKSRWQCGPKFKHKRIRAKILTCTISALILILVLTIYLGLALTNRQESQEFHVLLILVILVTTIFFCHALIRLCMLLLHPPTEEDDLEQQNLPSMIGPGGYANPVVPIRVVLARDEEAAGIESAATKVPPPVYGLWRESVRVDPNRLYWQRNNAALQRQGSDDRPSTATRPPSYISEDGVSYVVEAVPRSIAPTNDVPLPVHPSERGRLPSRIR